jgi:hypothetical protein
MCECSQCLDGRQARPPTLQQLGDLAEVIAERNARKPKRRKRI